MSLVPLPEIKLKLQDIKITTEGLALAAAQAKQAQDIKTLNAAFAKFATTTQGKAFLAEAKPPTPEIIQKTFIEWMKKSENTALPEVLAAAPLVVSKFTTEVAAASYASAKDATKPKDNSKAATAFNAFLKSPEGVKFLNDPKAPADKDIVEAFQKWVDTNGKSQGGKPPASKEATAALEEVKQPGVKDMAVSMFGAAKKAQTKTPAAEEEEQGFFGKNKGGIIGAIITAILGFFIGGPMGGLLGAVVGFGAGGAIGGDSNGVLSSFINPEPPSPKIAKPFDIKNSEGAKVKGITLKADGTATQKLEEAEVMLLGHMEGKGEDRKFKITGVSFKDTQMEFPATGELKVTKGGNIDVNAQENSTVIKTTDTAGRLAASAALSDALNKRLVAKVDKLNNGAHTNAAEALGAVQSGWQELLQVMKVNDTDRIQIARIITEKMANPENRKLGAEEQQKLLDSVLKEKLESGVTVEAALKDAARNGAGDTATGGKSNLDKFKDAFKATAPDLNFMLTERTKNTDGKIPFPPKTPVPKDKDTEAKLQADAALATKVAKESAEATVKKMYGKKYDLKPAASIDTAFPGKPEVPFKAGTALIPAAGGKPEIPAVPEQRAIPAIPNETAKKLKDAMKKTTGDEDKKQYLQIITDDKTVILVGKLNGKGEFEADSAIIQVKGQDSATTVALDKVPLASRTFEAKEAIVTIGKDADKNLATMKALLSTNEVNQVGAASAKIPELDKGAGRK